MNPGSVTPEPTCMHTSGPHANCGDQDPRVAPNPVVIFFWPQAPPSSALSLLQGEWGPGSDRASECELTSWTALGTWWVSDGMVYTPQFPAPRNLMWSLPARGTSPAPDCCPQWVVPPLQEALTCLVSLVSRTSPGMGTVPSSPAAPHTVGGRILHNEGRK